MEKLVLSSPYSSSASNESSKPIIVIGIILSGSIIYDKFGSSYYSSIY